MYQPRRLSAVLTAARRQFPAVLVTGPRQAGKTTFLMHEAGGTSDYVSFDDPLQRSIATADPNGFLDRFEGRSVILDEVQYVPEIFQYLKIRIDRDRKRNGKWLLTGSQHFHLMKSITESLAGRIAILELLPFSLLETKQEAPLELSIWNGGYPEPLLFPSRRDLWIKSYLQTYIERDVRQLQNVRDLRVFQTFVGICAARHGQSFNTALLSREVGASIPTTKAWATVLEASYLCHFLPPYFKNYGKRLVKTPKLYFLDPALVCALTRQPNGMSAVAGSMGGAIFEGLIFSEAVKVFTMTGRRPDLFYWRSNDRLEVDLVMPIGSKLCPVEIKLTSTPTLVHLEPLNKFKAIAGKDASEEGVLVCRTDKMIALPNHNIAVPWKQFPQWLLSELEKE